MSPEGEQDDDRYFCHSRMIEIHLFRGTDAALFRKGEIPTWYGDVAGFLSET